MSEQDIARLEEHIRQNQEQVVAGFERMEKGLDALKEWKNEADIGMAGDDHHGTWGYKQRIAYNKGRIDEIEKSTNDKIFEVREIALSNRLRINKIFWTVIGAGSVTGSTAALVFWIITTFVIGG